TILGDGPQRAKLARLADDLGIAPQVRFLGIVDDVPAQLLQADIFVLPSQAEGLSNAVLEAMAHSLACIATNVGGTPDLMRDGDTGLLVPVNDIDRLAAALARLAADPGLREQLGQRARRQVEAEFGIGRI